MKRFGLTLMAALCLATSSFAVSNQPTTEKSVKWNGYINTAKLSKYLDLDSSQYDQVNDICTYFNMQMSQAMTAKKDQDKKLRNAVYGNLKLMKEALNAKQYANYARILNVTLQNKGIEVK